MISRQKCSERENFFLVKCRISQRTLKVFELGVYTGGLVGLLYDDILVTVLNYNIACLGTLLFTCTL